MSKPWLSAVDTSLLICCYSRWLLYVYVGFTHRVLNKVVVCKTHWYYKLSWNMSQGLRLELIVWNILRYGKGT